MLPIHAVLYDLRAALAAGRNVVLAAPPGAGKTTVAPLALLDAPWMADGRLIVLEPRRLAARAAASRMAQTLGEAVGATVGLRMRMEARVGAATRIEVVTEGVFTRRVLDDPGLEGVAGVIFDEVHERSLDADLGLAFALDAQALLRPDLRLLAMSATLDGAAVSALMGDAPVIASEGRSFPVETAYLGRDPAAPLPVQMARAIRRALAEGEGGVLAFLPGAAEIRRTERELEALLRDPAVDVRPLYGALSPAEQAAAVEPAPPGRRKVVLATSIAETSLTLEGVTAVVDSGLSRVPRFDPGSGLTRLATVRVSRAAADQRRGRAGRTTPGRAYRLWDEAETRALPPFDRPEMLESDLSGVALSLARWGVREGVGSLRFLDPPPAAALGLARGLLRDLGAVDGEGALTPLGAQIARVGLPPRLAAMVVRAGGRGWEMVAARLAALLTEPGLGGDAVDLADRLERFDRDPSARAKDARRLADRWAREAGSPISPIADEGVPAKPGRGPLCAGERNIHAPKPVSSALRAAPSRPSGVLPHARHGGDGQPTVFLGLLVAEAFPERIARARGGGSGEYRLAGGRGARLDPTERLAREPWLAVADLGGVSGADDRIRAAAALDPATLEAAFADRIVEETRVETDADGRIRARRLRRLGALTLSETRLDGAAPELVAQALLATVHERGVAALPWPDASQDLRARVAFLRALDGDIWPDLSDAALLKSAHAWLLSILVGHARLESVAPGDLHAALLALIPWDLQRRLDVEAPPRFATPAGTSAAVDYAAEGGPRVEVRVQELYGLDRHPAVAGGRVPLTLALLSPARRPVQTTRDLPGFWRGSWKEVRTEMRGRYPRHPWPADPLTAPPTTRAKPRGT